MTSKLIFETDQDDETIRSLIIMAAKRGIFFKSCKNVIERIDDKPIYPNVYRLDMRVNK